MTSPPASPNPYSSPVPDATPARPWFYYGWVIVPIAALAMIATLPGRTHGLGLITVKLLEEFKLDQPTFASLNLWGTLLGAAFCLPCGYLIDRFGSRTVLVGVLAGLGAVTLWMTTVHSTSGLFVAILLSRGFGQSMLSVVSLAIVGKWFGRNLGWAMGAFTVLMGFGMGMSFRTIGKMAAVEGWRIAWTQMGWAILGLGVVTLLVGRSQPKDALREFSSKQANASGDAVRGATLFQALGNGCFWMFVATSSMFAMTSSGVSLFNESIFAERGFPTKVYHDVVGTSFLIGMVSNLFGGWLATRVPLGKLAAAAMFLLAGAYAMFPYVATLPQIYAYAAVVSAAGGLVTVLFFTIWGHAYGRGELGRIQGIAQMATVLASAAGPQIVASWQARTGSYAGAFQAAGVGCAMLGVWALVARVPDARTREWELAAEAPVGLTPTVA